MTLSLKNTDTKPALRLVVDNPGYMPTVFHSRLGLKRAFLKNHRVISNGPFLSKEDRAALKLANWVEEQYKEFVNRHFGESEALIHVSKELDETARKGAIKLLRERGYAANYTEIHNRTGARFSVSRIRGRK